MRVYRRSLRACLGLGVIASLIVGLGCNSSKSSEGEHKNSHVEASEDFPRGAHGGRLLRDKSFALELCIFEEGVAPHFRVYPSNNDNPVSPADVRLEIKLTRLGGKQESFVFEPSGNFLGSVQEVQEPHSFEVQVAAEFAGNAHSWSYNSFEGRTSMPQDVAEKSGIIVEHPKQQAISITRRIRGKIVPSEHRIAHVIPRFSGIVREGRKHIGDKVEKGEVLAIIESNQSLQPFEIRSQISGTVINGHLIVGEFVPENQWVYIVADLSEVWADFFIPLRDRVGITAGQKVRISSPASNEATEGRISYLAPYAEEKSQAQLVRAVVPNESNQFLPGMFITGDVVIDEVTAPIAVHKDAIQRFRGWDVVFVRYGDTFEARPINRGRTDGDWIEVLSGLSSDEEYVAKNAFLIKADILKSGATHDG